jgi:hypothetical protein
MFSWFTRKNKAKNNESNQAVLNRIEKEARQRRANNAYRKAQALYHTMPEVLKNENVKYAKKKGLLEKYGIPSGRPYAALPLAQYKVFEQELKNLRNANRKAMAEEKRRANEAFNARTRELEEEARQYEEERLRKLTGASDPRSASPTQGGTRRKKRGCRFSRRR